MPGYLYPVASAWLVMHLIIGWPSAWAQGIEEYFLPVGQGKVIALDTPIQDISVANPKVADVEPLTQSSFFVYARGSGATTIVASDTDGRVLTEILLRAEAPILQSAAQLLEQSPGINTRVENTSVVVTGTPVSAQLYRELAAQAAEMLRGHGQIIDKTTHLEAPQVQLNVKFAEISVEAIRRIGINWAAVTNTGNFAFGLVTGRPPFENGTLTVLEEGASALFGGFSDGQSAVNTLIDLFERDGSLSILAEPNLTAISGEEAEFLAGGEFPIPVPQGNETVTIEFKKFGVSVNFLPTVLPNKRLKLLVQPEVSQLSSNNSLQIEGFVVPSLITRRARTTIVVSEGETIAIAGLFQASNQRDSSGIPFLSDVPGLKELTSAQSQESLRTELVIFITPKILGK